MNRVEYSYLLFSMMPLFQVCWQTKLANPGSSLLPSGGSWEPWVPSHTCGHRHCTDAGCNTCKTCWHDKHLPVYTTCLCTWICWMKSSVPSKRDWDIPVYSCLIVLHGLEQQLQQAQTSKPWQGMLPSSSRQCLWSFHRMHLFWGGNEASRSGYDFNRQD